MQDITCPLCGKSASIEPDSISECYKLIHCENCFTFGIGETVNELNRKAYNLIYLYLINHKPKQFGRERYYYFFYSEQYLRNEDYPNIINVRELEKDYPKDIMEKMDLCLLNLSYTYNNIGATFNANDLISPILLCESVDDILVSNEKQATLEYLSSLGYLDFINGKYRISVFGKKRLDELNKTKDVKNQCFIAMKIGDETKEIYKTFQKAIEQSGYCALRIDNKEHNNQIVPEIFYEIKHSKFVVIDITFQNYGAYYEAGYAQALGKEVIVCCRKDKLSEVHFDISQKSMVLWSSFGELEKNLYKRIEVTVGLNK